MDWASESSLSRPKSPDLESVAIELLNAPVFKHYSRLLLDSLDLAPRNLSVGVKLSVLTL